MSVTVHLAVVLPTTTFPTVVSTPVLRLISSNCETRSATLDVVRVVNDQTVDRSPSVVVDLLNVPESTEYRCGRQLCRCVQAISCTEDSSSDDSVPFHRLQFISRSEQLMLASVVNVEFPVRAPTVDRPCFVVSGVRSKYAVVVLESLLEDGRCSSDHVLARYAGICS